MSLYLALDGGGTATRCILADEERVLGRAATGTVKLMNVDAATATARLYEVMESAALAGGVRLADVKRSCFGLAGLSSEGVRPWAEATMRSAVGGDLLLVGDDAIAFEAAFRGGPGLLVIAGTGAIVMGRCTDGTKVQAGGWGPVLGDEGSGYWIGLEAIKAGLRAQDRGAETCLLQEIEHHWRLNSQAELIALANGQARPQFAELTVVVARCAERGDALAAGVLERAGQELAAQVSLALSKMHQAGCSQQENVRLAFTGSVLGRIPRVLRAMEEALAISAPHAELQRSAVDALEGALWIARQG